MRDWFERVKWKTSRWMQGRYGPDELYVFLMVLGFICLFLSVLSPKFSILAFIFMLLAVLRCYSKNLKQRGKERNVFLSIVTKPQKWFRLQRRRWTDRKTYRYFKCNGCGQILRVPTGKGKIMITCPKCQKKNNKKT